MPKRSKLNPKDRPDFNYWMTPWRDRASLNEEELTSMLLQLREYSLSRFKKGHRFTLTDMFQGIPKGTKCTVISCWPTTKVRWDKWDVKGRGSVRPVYDMLFILDIKLEKV